MSDITESLIETVAGAYGSGQLLSIQGSNTKSFLTYDGVGDVVCTREHSGIIDYEPTELVLTARSGTTIDDINAALTEHHQMLAFDPPQFNGRATLGGIVATGLSGPARPWVGAARDFVLGVKIINGQGELLNFGGQVMKNVAGYDVSRLMAGAYGALGILLEVSLKVLPAPESEQTLIFEMDAENAIKQMNAWSGTPLPLSGACWLDDHLYVRLAGSSSGVRTASQQLGGEMSVDDDFWQLMRDFNHPFFNRSEPLWRLGFAPATPMLPITGQWLLDWGGAQRWLFSDEADDRIVEETVQHGGHYSQWHSHDKSRLRMPLDASILKLHQRLKAGFDPENILNRGQYYREL